MGDGSAHEVWRSQLTAARGPALTSALVERGVIDGPATAWRTTWGRFSPDGGSPEWATACLTRHDAERDGERIVCARLLDPPGGARRASERPGLEATQIALRWFPDDPGLPTLRRAIERHGPLEVVRYRPGRRCTARAGADPARFVKVFPTGEQAVHVHEEGVRLSAAGASAGFAVAAPVAVDPEVATVVQSAVPGVPAAPALFGPTGADMAARMGAAAATLPRLDLRPGAILDRWAQCERGRRYAAALGALVPGLNARLALLLAGIERLYRNAPERHLVPIHGGLHPHQWLDDGGRLGLIDFDRLCLGDPELDAATFLAEVDFERGTAVSPAELNAAFLAGFESLGGPLDPGLLRAYRVEKRLAKALRSARALRPDGDEAADRHLRRAEAGLAG
jgi:Ser/Thr protein kinase RdoA (MazF antagonist)